MTKEKLNTKLKKAKLTLRQYVNSRRLAHREVLPTSFAQQKRWSRPTSLMLRRVEDLLLHGRVIRQGEMWLQKTSLFKLGAEWLKHSFVLCDNNLYFFNKHSTTFADSGVVSIPNVTSLKAQDLRLKHRAGGTRFCVQVCLKGQSPLMCQCKTEEDRNTWLTALLATKAMSLLKDLKFDFK